MSTLTPEQRRAALFERARNYNLCKGQACPPNDEECICRQMIKLVLEYASNTARQWGKEQIEIADKLDSPEASDHGRARAWDATQIAHRIMALGEK